MNEYHMVRRIFISVHVKLTEHIHGSEKLCMVCTLQSLYAECQTRSQVYPSGIQCILSAESKGENNDVGRITHKTAYLGLMQHWQPGNQEDAHEFMVAILDRINNHLVVDAE